MLNFVVAPLVVWICVSGIYSLFELFVRQKERMFLLEKYGDKLYGNKLDAAAFNSATFIKTIGLPNFVKRSFSGLKIGCLLFGLGLGLLVGLMITTELVSDGYDYWKDRELYSVAYAASLLLFGGAALLVSFLIENRIIKNRPDHKPGDPEIG